MMAVNKFLLLLSITFLSACGGSNSIKPTPKPPTMQTPAEVTALPSNTNSGGYYLDDGPGENAPADIDSIPSAALKTEPFSKRANRPYSTLGQNYTPMTAYAPYKKQGMASWYGKRYHGKKTSTGEIYDMYAMSAAHTILPIPSYAKVTNPSNGRSVIVRINDRGPFKRDRLIDLSYAAAYQLRLIKQGSGLVEVEAMDTSAEALQVLSNNKTAQTSTSQIRSTLEDNLSESAIKAPANTSYYVQVGVFKNQLNGELLQKKIQGLNLLKNVSVANVYNNGLYRVTLGPYASKQEADNSAAIIRSQLNIATLLINQ